MSIGASWFFFLAAAFVIGDIVWHTVQSIASKPEPKE